MAPLGTNRVVPLGDVLRGLYFYRPWECWAMCGDDAPLTCAPTILRANVELLMATTGPTEQESLLAITAKRD